MSRAGKVTFNTRGLKQLDEALIRALGLTAYELQREIRNEQIVPRDTGALQNEKFFVDESRINKGLVSLVFEGPYARRLYYHPEYNFQRTKNPNAQAYWLFPWMRGGKYEKRPFEVYAALLRKEV